MKKFFFTLIFLFAIILVYGKNIRVGPSRNLRVIKTALELAVDGDTISIDAGIYKEGNIVVSKRVTIIGNNYPVIDGEYRFEVITIKSSGVVIDGLKVINSGISLNLFKTRLPFVPTSKVFDRKLFETTSISIQLA